MYSEKVAKFIKQHSMPGELIVLKGYDAEDYVTETDDLEEVFADRFRAFSALAARETKVIPYNEFLCLFQLINMQFRAISVVENPRFRNCYPLEKNVGDSLRSVLTEHFKEHEFGDEECEFAFELTEVYGNVISTAEGTLCCYSVEAGETDSLKVERVCVEQIEGQEPEKSGQADNGIRFNLCEEKDYFELAVRAQRTEEIFLVTYDSFDGGKNEIYGYLCTLNAATGGRIRIFQEDTAAYNAEPNPEVTEIMKKYWGYDEYRDIRIYDMNALEDGIKSVRTISQTNIINDLIEQTENCISGRPYRDVFVTAPTGSGKSLMFQLPAMYLAEKYNLVTLVITPLIGLMNDQVNGLEKRGYFGAKTINSDIPPIVKQQILSEVAEGKCSILYLSPESLLSRSDIQQLIGSRKIGMLVVDEAHIVTTWGKQFRPDYWYLGDHVKRIRKEQAKAENSTPFIIATFTATAIYEGTEDMYHETLNSLHMIDPITYLGYMRRDNISIEIEEVEIKRNTTEYELNKFEDIISMFKKAMIRNQKTLIYFPTVALINRFVSYCHSLNVGKYVAVYNGQMDAADKNESFDMFRDGKKPVMAATKAFGMGIDIPDITNVIHFAPTGNVCDYTQEIGRAARDQGINGHAIYHHMSNDFKHINRMHGLSTVKEYQLTAVITKILDLYNDQIRRTRIAGKGRKNEMLVDANDFAYIFGSGTGGDENDTINKVKTAMLLIQKDYENRGFAPFKMRPMALFKNGFFALPSYEMEKLNSIYHNAAELVDKNENVCRIDLQKIWEDGYDRKMSFPKFKYLLYSRSDELELNSQFNLTPAVQLNVSFEKNAESRCKDFIRAVRSVVMESVTESRYIGTDEIKDTVKGFLGSKSGSYRASNATDVLISAIEIYQKEFTKRINSGMMRFKSIDDGNKKSFIFYNSITDFFRWLERGFRTVYENCGEEDMYLVNSRPNYSKEITVMLGVFEAAGILKFDTLGGSNSQIYIYIFQTRKLEMVKNKQENYKNRLLESIDLRYKESVRMLTYLFRSGFSSEEIWDRLENYFIGILPEELKN